MVSCRVWRFRVENDEKFSITGRDSVELSVCQLHVQVRESVDSLIHKGGESVQLSGVEVTAEDAAHVSAGEASAHGGIRGSGQVTELKLEGVEECIDDGNLETQGAWDNGHHQSQEAGEQGSDQLCQDDGGKHHHEHWDEVGELAQVQPLLLGGAIAPLVISVVVGGAGGGVPSPGGRGVGGVVASRGLRTEPGLRLRTPAAHTG